ncbi:MAG: hypothetical protein JO168_12085 [Solirubrobacterales bacterium]|nr:hypothetical protein [Solirubrobacterales bacterium]MBV9716313.1 hypothetical protein [Solirubrobacterales bacterium]
MATEPALPRSIRRGPRITLTCHCGERRYLKYGESWTCEKCGRRWNTRRIPMEQYAAIRREQLRYRRIPLAVSALSLICVVVFIILGQPFAGLVLVAFAATTWSMFVRPIHSRRYRRRIANLPTWKIDPE